MLEKKRIKKIGCRGQKGSTGQGYGQLAQPVEELVDRLCSSDRRPVEEGQKVSLSPSSLIFPVEGILFPVEGILFPVDVRSRTSRGPVEATVTCHVLNAPTASEPVDP